MEGGGGGHPKYLGLQWGPGKKIAYVEGGHFILHTRTTHQISPPPPPTPYKRAVPYITSFFVEIVIPVKYLDKGRGLEWHEKRRTALHE